MATEQGSALPPETEEGQRPSQSEGADLEREEEDKKPKEPDFCLESILRVHHDLAPVWA